MEPSKTRASTRFLKGSRPLPTEQIGAREFFLSGLASAKGGESRDVFLFCAAALGNLLETHHDSPTHPRACESM